MSKPIERRLELWEIDYTPKEDSNPVELTDLFEYVKKLPFSAEVAAGAEPSLVRELRDTKDILVVDCSEVSPNHIKGVFGKGKDVDVPRVRRGRRKKSIKLGPGEYIEYPCHFVVFDENLAVFERNPSGPSPSSLGIYLSHKCQELVKTVSVNRVPRGDFLKRFHKIQETRSIILRLGIKAIRKLGRSSDDGMWAGLIKEHEQSGFGTVTIRFSMSRKPGGLGFQWLKRIPEVVQDRNSSSDLLRLEINARMQDSGEVEVIRLLKKASMEKTVRFKVLGDNKNLDSETVYREIHSVYSKFRRIMEGKEDDEYLDLVQEKIPSE